ncbi:MAG: hypothetical protein R3272_13700 [Candidatus Promineifilaceae bacterium]|nr:hypothetical protein [Candidatus Promineifilaceae bacterium]
MIGKHFGRTIHVPGALTANLDIRISVPVDCRLHRVSAVASNASSATVDVGLSDDTDEILAARDAGDSGTPAVYGLADFASTNPTGRLLQGEILVVTVDFDGAAGTAAQNLTVDLDFIAG